MTISGRFREFPPLTGAWSNCNATIDPNPVGGNTSSQRPMNTLYLGGLSTNTEGLVVAIAGITKLNLTELDFRLSDYIL